MKGQIFLLAAMFTLFFSAAAIAQNVVCTDSDGQYIYGKGTAVQENYTASDVCLSSSFCQSSVNSSSCVLEAYCSPTTILFKIIPCPGICSDGACLASSDSAQNTNTTCTDSDGEYIYGQGTASQNNYTATDTCLSSSVCQSDVNSNSCVLEAYCSPSGILFKTIACPGICSDGACLAYSDTTPPSANVTCVDSDGDSVTTRGSVKKYSNGSTVNNYEDFCASAASVREYFCINNSVTDKTIQCPAGRACSKGACVEQSCGNGICEESEKTCLLACPMCAEGTPPEKCQCTTTCTYHCEADCKAERACTDTDGGKVWSVVGKTYIGNEVYYDTCREGMLLEYFCSNDTHSISKEAVTCKGVCMEGACVEGTAEIKLISPNGGESFEVGSSQKIVWSSRASVDIYLVSGGGTPCTGDACPQVAEQHAYMIAKMVPGGYYVWTVGNLIEKIKIQDGYYYIKVVDPNTDNSDISDSYFKIIAGSDSRYAAHIRTNKEKYAKGEKVEIIVVLRNANAAMNEMTLAALVARPDGARESVTLHRSSDGRVCTADAKMCPDGSYVGRTGPNCEFTPCPATAVAVTGQITSVQTTSSSGQSVSSSGVAYPIYPIYPSYATFTGVYENTDLFGTYKVGLDSAGIEANVVSFNVFDASLLEKYVIMHDIRDYKFAGANAVQNFGGTNTQAYTAMYHNDNYKATAVVVEFDSREASTKFLETAIRERGGGFSRVSIDDSHVVFAGGNGRTVAWTHDNFIIIIQTENTVYPATVAVQPAVARSAVTEPSAAGIVTAKITATQPAVPALYGEEMDMNTPVVTAYLLKYPSDTGVEIKKKEVRTEDLLDVAFKLENLYKKMDELQRNSKTLAAYYTSIGDNETANKFERVSNLFGQTKDRINDIKTKIRDGLNDPTITEQIKEDIKDIKSYLRAVLLVMVGADDNAVSQAESQAIPLLAQS